LLIHAGRHDLLITTACADCLRLRATSDCHHKFSQTVTFTMPPCFVTAHVYIFVFHFMITFLHTAIHIKWIHTINWSSSFYLGSHSRFGCVSLHWQKHKSDSDTENQETLTTMTSRSCKSLDCVVSCHN